MTFQLDNWLPFGDLIVRWRCQPEDACCYIELWWDGDRFLETTLRRQFPNHTDKITFNLRREGSQRDVASGQLLLLFNAAGMHELVLELAYMEEHMQRHLLWSSQPQPVPPVPTPSLPAPLEEQVDHARIAYCPEADLFPYLYLRCWPSTTRQQRTDRFIDYLDSALTLPHSELYAEISSYTRRADKEAAAVRYMRAGEAGSAHGMLTKLTQLPEPLCHFAACLRTLCTHTQLDWQQLHEEIPHQLHWNWTALRQEIQLPQFHAAIGRCWDSVLALTLVPGERRALLDSLIETIVLASLLARVSLLLAEPEEASAPTVADCAEWSAARIMDGMRATLILPPLLFSNAPLDDVIPPPASRVIPYAIGDLELVRQRLTGYALGEVSHIDSVMPGESMETTRRQLERSNRSESIHGQDEETDQDSAENGLNDYQNEAQRSLSAAFTLDKNTSYGPPTEAIAQEKISMAANADHSPQLQYLEAAAQHARQITSRTAAQLTRRAEWQRNSSTLREREETVVHRIDGSQSQHNRRGIRRWVDKLYQAYVINYGQRLILECRLEQPAANYLAEQEVLFGRRLRRPPTPAECGVELYTDIALDPASPAYYARLIALYQAYDVALPPEACRVVSINLPVGPAGAQQLIPIMEGYQTSRATITATWTGTGSVSLHGTVGGSAYNLTVSSATETASIALALHAESGALPLCAAWSSADTSGACLAAVDIYMEPTIATLQQWQFQLYQTIQDAYQRQLRTWLDASGAASEAPRNPLESQQAVRQALCGQIRQALWLDAQDTLQRQGADRLPDAEQDRYRQFFNQAFEWNELSYSLSDALGASPGQLLANDGLLSAFLQTALARALLPVRPEFAEQVSYFLATGMLWQGQSNTTPTLAPSVDLVNELKQSVAQHGCNTFCSQSWEFRIPTTMTVLQEGAELPAFPH